ncbi:MAG: hypothetical protein SFU83_07915 [Meiothermus sp.]|nr:hypothetical protein [Meiothermus sp.]
MFLAVDSTPTVNFARLRDVLFRLGFASVFLVNGLTELIDPYAHLYLMQQSVLNYFIADFTALMKFVAFSDLLLAALILFARWNGYLMLCVGLWLLAVTGLRLLSLVPGGDPVELLNGLLDTINQLQ